jgi:hypothetical protein
VKEQRPYCKIPLNALPVDFLFTFEAGNRLMDALTDSLLTDYGDLQYAQLASVNARVCAPTLRLVFTGKRPHASLVVVLTVFTTVT